MTIKRRIGVALGLMILLPAALMLGAAALTRDLVRRHDRLPSLVRPLSPGQGRFLAEFNRLALADPGALADPRRLAELAALVAYYLAVEGFQSEVGGDGEGGLAAALSGAFDLVVLDLMLPRMDGFEVCRRLRASSDLPIIIFSARREDGDKIRGLGFGADDYVTEPFSPAELVARVKGQRARYERLTGKAGGPADRWIAEGKLEVNFEARRVRKSGVELSLTAKEFEILSLFVRNPCRAFTKDEIYGDGTTVTVHIRRLMEKIEDDPSNPGRIETVWGIGYRWRAGQPGRA